MSERDHESRRDEIAAYLVGALEPSEAAALERHLAGCPDCRAELRWLQPAAQMLPESVERVEPPPELRERILGQASSEIAPAPTQAASEPSRAKRTRWPLFSGWRPLAGFAALALVAAAIAGYAIRGDSGRGGATTTMVAGKPPGVTARMTQRRRRRRRCASPTSTSCRATGSSRPGCGATAGSSPSARCSCPTAKAAPRPRSRT